jgi:hypothetical protein
MSEDNKVDIKHEDDEHTEWQICCSKSSKAFIKYMVTVAISIIVLIFSIVMIYTNPDNDNSIYFSLLSSTLVLYVPAPTLDKTN